MVEVIGGIEPARTLIVEALMGGKPVVTANKELIATHGRELFETAEGAGVDILFEASVAGGIPLIRPLRESLAGDRIRRVMGIVNGTTNYILTRMTDAGASFADALAEAQRLGFAETDPTADVEGFDAAAKAAIIASIAFGARVVAGDVYREGITEITLDDIASAARPRLRREAARGRRGARRRGRGARAPGDGAGAPPARRRCATRSTRCSSKATRSASSCSTAAAPAARPPRRRCSATSSTRPRTWSRGARAPPSARWRRSRSVAIDDVESQFYLMMEVRRPPRRARTRSRACSANTASRSGRCSSASSGDDARLIFVTHKAKESDLRATVRALRDVEQVHRVGSVLRVIGEEE